MNLKEQIKRTEEKHRGKANIVYLTTDPGYLELESTDNVSANNGERRGVIPGKGLANNTVSTMLFERFNAAGILTHYVGPGSNDCSKIVRAAEPILLECILRNNLTGSYIKAHPDIPDMTPSDPPLFELTLKDDALGDPRISIDDVIDRGILNFEQTEQIEQLTRQMNDIAKDFFDQLGILLIDFKVEFGFVPGTSDIMVIDEFSCDTSRLHDMVTGRSLDKDPYRKGEADVGFGYAEVLRRINEEFIES